MQRRKFITKSSQTGIALSLLGLYACSAKKKKIEIPEAKSEYFGPFFKLSLAQWSFHKAIRDDKTMPVLDFAKKAKELGFEGLEYVSQLYSLEEGNEVASLSELVKKLKAQSDAYGMTNVLIMIDDEGDLSHPEKELRDISIEKHTRWIVAAKALGCTSVRVNLTPYGADSDEQIWHKMSVDGLGRLADIGAEYNINVIVENHGGISSDGAKLTAVIKEINKDNCGTLPDFGNFCIEGSPTGECKVAYDRYTGVSEMMPYAKGVSAKSYDFDIDGNETKIDYKRMLQIVKDAGYSGYIGVEYEGSILSEQDGIIATKKLLLKVGKEIG